MKMYRSVQTLYKYVWSLRRVSGKELLGFLLAVGCNQAWQESPCYACVVKWKKIEL